MKKCLSILLSSILLLAMAIPVTSVKANVISDPSKDKIYEKHYTVDLKDIDLKINGDDIDVIAINENVNAIKLNNLLSNKSFKNDLKDMILNGHKPKAIGVAEAIIEKVYDNMGNVIDSRPLTESEVLSPSTDATSNNSTSSGLLGILNTFKTSLLGAISAYRTSSLGAPSSTNIKLYTNGQPSTRDTLSLYTSISGSSPNYWVQSNAYWSSGEISNGWEVLGLTWDGNFHCTSYATTINYTYSTENASLEDFEPYSGMSFSFHDGQTHYGWGSMTNYLRGAYIGGTLVRNGSYGRHYFISEYVHTSESLNWVASISASSSSATGVTITLSPTPISWKLISWIDGSY
ncbi:MAG: hypothetical protein ABRQ25_14690 [Clostridiaceae bacterium]